MYLLNRVLHTVYECHDIRVRWRGSTFMVVENGVVYTIMVYEIFFLCHMSYVNTNIVFIIMCDNNNELNSG